MNEREGDSLPAAGLATVAVAGAVTGASLLATGGGRMAANMSASVSAASASRFLTQSTFGPNDQSIADVQSAGFAGWTAAQIASSVSGSHLEFINARNAEHVSTSAANLLFYGSFWAQAILGPDQLRQKMKLALSEIFVISLGSGTIAKAVDGAASYYDLLGQNAFGNFRTLLEQVTLHPMMGVWLTYISNVPANPLTGQHPDENYAREVMQLMTIGLHQLNQDGTPVLDGSGNPIPTYSHADIAGLAAVFTGFSFWTPNPVATGHGQTFYPKGGIAQHAGASTTPMIAYPYYHQTTAKTFLGTTIPASLTPDPLGDLRIALDTLFNHPNVGPFIGRQLIQRLVTSNPSPAYVSRVAAVFNDDGTGVRGNLGAVAQAILLDTEARDDTVATSPTFGKIREPIIRLANWMRAFKANSLSGDWAIPTTSPPTALDQTVLTAASVFNFWTPFYIPPNTALSAAGLVAPEFQVVDEVTVAGYLNTIYAAIAMGVGGTGHDVQADYSTESGLAANVANLIARLNLILMAGQMSVDLQSRIASAVNAIAVPAGPPAAVATVLMHRAQLAIFMTFAAPEFQVQR